MKKILIVGATSAIAQACARRWAERGDAIYLMARDQERLGAIKNDLAVRGAADVQFAVMDVNDFASHAARLEQAVHALGGLDVALVAHGTLGDQKACEQDFAVALRELNTNAISVMSMLTWLANHMEQQQHGVIAVIGSVAGERGRQSNYVYGTAKGALSIFLQGLRNRLFRSGVHVLTIKPGFVDTPMTAAFKKGPLWATPEAVAGDIVSAIEARRDVVYTPFFWRYIMMLIGLIPEFVFKKMKL